MGASIMRIILAGNPNSGKTTLFNVLTGDNQRVGNWPGVTVKKKSGSFLAQNHSIEVTDLPGIYSVTELAGSSPDEKIATHALKSLPSELIINIVDACHLERHLYLTSQLLELEKPMIVVLTMMDIAEQRGISINIEALAKQLNCQVIPIQAHKKIGLEALISAIVERGAASERNCQQPLALDLPLEIQKKLIDFRDFFIKNHNMGTAEAIYSSYRMMEGDHLLDKEFYTAHAGEEDDIILADARYKKIHSMVSNVQKKRSDASEHFTAKLDKLMLHRYFALPIFFGMMYLMFLFAINVGGAFQDFFDISTDTIFVKSTAWLLDQIQAPHWVTALVANGIGKGINTTLTFIPVIASMFFFLALLESSGYMARAAFVVDKLMRILGLPGKSFVPMIVGFGCNVPSIMAARTLDSERDRLLTILMSPFMSCSARLAIYAVFVAAFFPTGGQNIVFALYLTGIIIAVLTGLLLRRTTLKGQASPLILELPAYHKPSLRRLFKDTGFRLRYFVTRASRMIIPICILLGGLNALTITGDISNSEANAQSVLSLIGQWATPLFSPMGITQDNWPATVGLLTGMLAKEVVVGSLNSLYSQMDQVGQFQAANFDFLGSLKMAFLSIPQNLSQLGDALLNPILASAPQNEVSQAVYGTMFKKFDGQAGAFAYLLFILLYIPCVSTMAAIRQEANSKWMWFSIAWALFVAYALAVLFYQWARFSMHPEQSLIWTLLLGLVLVLFITGMRFTGMHFGRKHAIGNS
jgi:ferrous iron transport protein B